MLAWLLVGCATGRATVRPVLSTDARSELHRAIDSMAAAPAFRNAHWGILVVDPLSGDTLYSRNAGKLFIPASNMKILTGATALEQLGPDFTYRTSFVARGAVSEGLLAGDLVVVGRGDPSVSDHMQKDAMIPLRAIAESLSAHGVRRISGTLLAGGDAFPGPVLGYGWSWDDLEDSYSAGVDELLFNEGFSEVRVVAGQNIGDSARVESKPARTFPKLRASVVTIAPPAPDSSCPSATDSSAPCTRQPGARRSRPMMRGIKDTANGDVIVTGAIAVGDSMRIEVTHRDPDAAYLAALREALRDAGIFVEDHPANGDSLTTIADTVFVMHSPPLRDILPVLMKPSQNQIAEIFLRTLGLERAGIGRADSGRAVVERQLSAWGAEPDGYVVRDGSGLSRYDYVTPETVVRVLDAMRKSPQFEVFYNALPIAGVDGTIKTRMRGTPAEGNIHAKTGSVANVRSLSGYVRTQDGRSLIFSLLANNWTTPASDVTRMQDAIAARLAALRLQ